MTHSVDHRWPKPLPKWFWPWLRWYLGEGEFKGKKRDPKSRPWTPQSRIPGWAWEKQVEFVRARKKTHPRPPVPPPVPPPVRQLTFWHRMGVWITRIDHFPAEWLPQYARDEYPIVIVPCLFGKELEVNADELRRYIQAARSRGYAVVGSQWGKATDPASAVEEAAVGATQCQLFGFDGWVFNGEKIYEGGGKSAAYAREFRRRLPDIPFGWSPEPRISLDHAVLQELGVCYMPQAYPLENGKDVEYVVHYGLEFGYAVENIVPLIQAYPNGDGKRFDPRVYVAQARARGVKALVLYAGNQAADVPQYWRELVV